MKKILFLGGSTHQIPVLEYAEKQGYYSILCDYINDNPGQHHADEYYNVSTTDKEAILEIASRLKVDGIVAYATDPAAPIAAYVANQLGLPSNPYESVEILSKKDKFRAFLTEHGFNCPKARSYTEVTSLMNDFDEFKHPVILKPIDSSGSKGVTRVKHKRDLLEAFDVAMSHSRDGKVIMEEFINMSNDYMIAGDAFVSKGKLIYVGLLNGHRNDKGNPFVPIGTSYPLILSSERRTEVIEMVQKVIDILEMKQGALNLELMYDDEGKLYIIEIGPRNGGNMIPDFLRIIDEVDMIKATVEVAIGNEDLNMNHLLNEEVYSTYVMHSHRVGYLEAINHREELKPFIIKQVTYSKIGNKVEIFDGSNKALGILFLKFPSIKLMKHYMNHMEEYVDICVV